MHKKIILILSGLAVTLLLFTSVYFYCDPETFASDQRKVDEGSMSQSLIDIERRLSALEDQLDREINRLNNLEGLIDDIDNKPANTASINPEVNESVVKVTDLGTAFKQLQESSDNKRYERIEQISRFKKAGFSDDDALWLVDKIDNIRIDGIYEVWERRRQNYLEQKTESKTVLKTAREQIKERFGPEDFEKYLTAMGNHLSIEVFGVIDDSPVAQAGLLPGDEIISYNGARVYYYMELDDATVHGELGEPVTLGIIRNGEEIQLNMERGPLGFTTRPDLIVFTPADQVEGRK